MTVTAGNKKKSTAKLRDYLLADNTRDKVVADCASVIEQHVASRSGMTGIGMRTGLAMVNAAKPNIVPRAVEWLLPDFAQALEPQFQASRIGKQVFADALMKDSERTVSALLGVADMRAAQVKSKAVRSVYARMRESAENEVAQALPALARALSRHLPPA